MILVGDMNIAASTKDVHPALHWARMYHKEELSIMQAILSQYTDVWRKQNPGVTDCYTVWDEKTFSRSVNKASSSLGSICRPSEAVQDLEEI